MSDKTSREDDELRASHGLAVQPRPKPNGYNSAHDIVARDLIGSEGYPALTEPLDLVAMYSDLADNFENVALALGENPQEVMTKRKEFGLAKYGTILQPANGRSNLRDLLDELGDALVYLKCEIMQDGWKRCSEAGGHFYQPGNPACAVCGYREGEG